MDPATAAIVAAIAQSFVSAGLQAAMPKYGMTTPENVPQTGGMDLQALVSQGQQQSNLPKLQLQNRLPQY